MGVKHTGAGSHALGARMPGSLGLLRQELVRKEARVSHWEMYGSLPDEDDEWEPGLSVTYEDLAR